MSMDWTAQIDAYCERVGFGFWAEPINALTNIAFLVSGFVIWRKAQGRGLPLAEAMAIVLFAIGIGSFLFHTFATRWAGAMDTAPILIFVLLFTFAATWDLFRQSLPMAAIITLLFFPFMAVAYPIGNIAPWLGSSAGYIPVLLWIGLFAIMASGQLAWDFWTGFALLALSITFRSLDERVCGQLPIGTHFLWHLLNAFLLGWFASFYIRHMLAAKARQG
ncbi:ceramidase domain-containing protein [uncultured Maritimibacter sp.]|uniref:ceramidase domain-containing protein n=1 Tax=uncultured Maritimibacter sp. TaxID=991866 RepID=UPI002592C8F9|nr:ceramidase domain-containing protein [uncultured Maritimibacter sp.]